MKVFIDGLIFGRQRFGGISRMWEEYLARLPDAGIEVQLLVPFGSNNASLQRVKEQGEKFEWMGSDFFHWPKRFFERVGVRSRILELFYLQKTTRIFHSTYFSTVFRRDIKKVVTVYDMILELFSKDFPSKWNRLGIETKRKALQNADLIVAISQATRQDIMSVFPGISPERIRVVHPGVDVRPPSPADDFSRLAAHLGIPFAPGRYFIFIGNRSGYKNFYLIADALAVKKCHDIFFVCVGGEDPARDRRLLKDRGVSENFRFIDWVGDAELRILYQNAYALVYPSKHEGFGLPLLEAMANDCPVLCSDIEVFREVCREAAVFFDPCSPESFAAAIDGFLGSDRRLWIQRGQENVKRFSWEESTRRLAALYRTLE